MQDTKIQGLEDLERENKYIISRFHLFFKNILRTIFDFLLNSMFLLVRELKGEKKKPLKRAAMINNQIQKKKFNKLQVD